MTQNVCVNNEPNAEYSWSSNDIGLQSALDKSLVLHITRNMFKALNAYLAVEWSKSARHFRGRGLTDIGRQLDGQIATLRLYSQIQASLLYYKVSKLIKSRCPSGKTNLYMGGNLIRWAILCRQNRVELLADVRGDNGLLLATQD